MRYIVLKPKSVLSLSLATVLACLVMLASTSGVKAAANPCGQICQSVASIPMFAAATQPSCGGGKDNKPVVTSIDIGCRGQGNPILDMMFAILRLLSNGVGLVIVASIIVGGIQYTMSAGDPQATAKAIGRIRATLIALLLYIFAYPLLNYLLPAGFF